ncbi:hypothetical protein DPMN_169462 [Dreissena polymorpha]|uniref:Uncharacterized protein n=1 Tax=Dreissena polymorpha TaxID=45954 RepID=A0A9D4DWT0_DREPO|nr:hypothetical protein DPMN_169462 [Dreissena polymorpha]
MGPQTYREMQLIDTVVLLNIRRQNRYWPGVSKVLKVMISVTTINYSSYHRR